jgi:hypothetical protein
MKPWQVWAGKLGDKLLDAGNIALGALVIGQLISGQPLNWKLAVVGVGAWLVFALLSLLMVSWSRGERA